MATAVRRVVLLAVVRPVVEHASTVWCTTAPQQQRLEQVQTRVLRLPCGVADDVLRMELGCRPYVGWASASWSLPSGWQLWRLTACLPG
jgi:hypothetical protein